jgi:hypothetical protein
MRKHIFGFALFAFIISSAIFSYRLTYTALIEVDEGLLPRKETPPFVPSMPIIKPASMAKDIRTINAASVTVDVNTRKVYVLFGNGLLNPAVDSFARVIFFTESSNESVFQTEWLRSNPNNNSHLIFACGDCAAMSYKKNYYARIYFASAPDDANLRLRLENEKGGGYYLQTTSVLVNSGKVK